MIESLKKQQPLRKRGKGNRKLDSKREAKPSQGKSSSKASKDERPRRDRGGSSARGSGEGRGHHFLGLLLGSLAALVLLALVSEAGPRWAGPLGHRLASDILRPLGLLSFALPLALGLGAAILVGLVRLSFAVARRSLALLAGSGFGLLFVAVVRPQTALFGWPVAGRWLSTAAEPIAAALSPVGGGLLAFAVAFACFSVVSDHALSRATVAVLKLLGRVGAAMARWGHGAVSTAVQEHLEARSHGEESGFDRASLAEAAEEEAEKRGQLITLGHSVSGTRLVFQPVGSLPDEPIRDEDILSDEPGEVAQSNDPPEILTIGEDGRVRGPKPSIEPLAFPPEDQAQLEEPSDAAEFPLAGERLSLRPQAALEVDPQIVASRESSFPKRKRGGAFTLQRSGAGFKLPALDLLELPPAIAQDIDRNALTDTAQKLTQKLADFGIKGRVETIRPGPVITMYEFVPAPGIRVSKIASLADDLAMAMEALQVRIVAPIPGKSVVGIEVPNRQRQKVYLREILEDDGFAKMNSPLTLAFGKDTEGSPYVGDLTRMPHLLVAGTTGSGKSVSMNSIIMSLLFKASPEDVRLIMIDPKMVELSMYEGIPHLLLPVVQDAQKAPLALKWAVEEMERRYHLIGKLKVKDLKAYNEKVARLKQGEKIEEPPDEPPKKVLVIDVANGETEEEALARLGEQKQEAEAAVVRDGAPRQQEGIDPSELEKLPYIVIIIDELADLMMVASRDVEQSIARLAAKARAAGIHLVIATQRPSTDVISGVIKSNLPVRVAFRLASRHDSATIINGPGAERLLGEGDMLHIPPGCSDALRLHGAWLREAEIERVVDFWKAQGKPVYDEEILRPRSEEREDGGEESVSDELYDQALAVVCQLDRVSISLLQRKMGVGYNRAADLIERMERERVIGPANGIKPREVLIKPVGEARL